MVLDGSIYVSGKDKLQQDTVLVCNPEQSTRPFWQTLPSCPVNWFAMAVLNHQLVLVGGQNKVAVWNNQSKTWDYPYPNMPTARRGAAAISYGTWLVVAGGDIATHRPINSSSRSSRFHQQEVVHLQLTPQGVLRHDISFAE